MKSKWLLVISLLLVATLGLVSCKSAAPVTPAAPPVPAGPPVVAKISIVSGEAEYQAAGSSSFVAAADGKGISVGDRVRSKAGAQVGLEFVDGSALVLLADTEIEVQAYDVVMDGDTVQSRVGRVAVINGDVTGDVREDLAYPPSVFEIVTPGEIYTIKGTLAE